MCALFCFAVCQSDLRVLGLAPRHDKPNRARCKRPLHKMTELPAESDANLFNNLSSPAAKAAYVVSRFVFEKLPPVTIAVERVLKSSLACVRYHDHYVDVHLSLACLE